MPRDPVGEVTFRRPAFVGATVALGLVGAVVATYGPVLVGIAHHFHRSVSTAGLALSANFVGAVLGVLVAWSAVRRVSGRGVLAAGLLTLAAGLVAAALAGTFDVFIGAVALAGIGFGAVDFAVVALVSRTEPTHRARRLSVSGSGWGFGAVLGPLCIVVVHPAHYAVVLGVAGGVALCLVATTGGLAAPPSPRAAVAASSGGGAVRSVFLVALGAYVALETAVAGWLATQLHSAGDSAALGAGITAGFWGGLALGRLVAGRASHGSSHRRWVVVGLAVAVVALLGASDRTAAPVLYPLIGLCVASVFPLGLHWFTELAPGDHTGVALVILVDMLAGAVGSGAENLGVATWGPRCVPFVAAGFAVVCGGVFLRALRFEMPARDGSATAGQ